MAKNYFETPLSWIDSEALSLSLSLSEFETLVARSDAVSDREYSAFTVLSMGQISREQRTDRLSRFSLVDPSPLIGSTTKRSHSSSC